MRRVALRCDAAQHRSAAQRNAPHPVCMNIYIAVVTADGDCESEKRTAAGR